ncbi:unnamed protein product [Candida verbasci]|uniref:DNA-directed RNA polymerase III subunit n=1 Tax=Candida verbasci TaxID=1227364 RepID=A0A9W4TRK9_9ASCO|nr:unnamed protein product [Candida verbasci]
MSFRGGRSGGSQRTILPFGLDYADILSTSQVTEKPQLLLPVNGDITEMEQDIAKQSITFANLMSEGAFYTGDLMDIKEKEKEKTKLSTTYQTNDDGIERYSDRYKQTKKIGRTIEEHPYNLEFFPEELYSVMGITNKNKKKLLALSKFKSKGGLREFLSDEKQEDLKDEEKVKQLQQQMLNMIEDDNKKDDGEEEKEEEEEDVDDEYEDEDDDDDDYNAEKYFDDGDDDDGNEDGGDDEAAF